MDMGKLFQQTLSFQAGYLVYLPIKPNAFPKLRVKLIKNVFVRCNESGTMWTF